MPPDEPIRIQVTESPRRAPSKRTGRRRLWLGSAVISLVVAVGTIAFLLLRGDRPPSPATPPSRGERVASSAVPVAPAAAPAAPKSTDSAGMELVDDSNGDLLWAPPTNGPPISLAYVPSGTQCLIHLRPAAVMAHPEGERILAALGPWGDRTVDRLQAIMHVPPAGIDSLLITLTIDGNDRLEATFRAALTEPLDEQALAERLPGSSPRARDGVAYRVKEELAYLLVDQPSPSLLVAPVPLVEDLIDSRGDAPPLVRDIEALVATSDEERDATAIVAPKFLLAGGNALFSAEATPLHDALGWLLDDKATAIAASVDWGDDFFVEVRATPALNVPARRLAIELRRKLAEAPGLVEDDVLAEPWHRYGRKVVARLPGMLRTLARYARAGEEDRQAVVRAYLPAIAGHNILLAGELLLTLPRGQNAELASGNASSTAAGNSAQAQRIETVDERLGAITSLSFTKESLEQALLLLAEDLGVEIEIAGGDLQLDGITKNQSLGLNLRERPAREILLEILLRANPDRQATGPADPRQKLVYVVKPTTPGQPGRIIVTTRTAAEKRGDSLPEPFRRPSR